jgi:hypothetical protein
MLPAPCPQGLDKVWSSMGAERLEAGLAASRAAGIDPSAIFARLSGHPTLGPKLQNPRVLAALMDCCRWAVATVGHVMVLAE